MQMSVPAVLVCQHFCSVTVVANNSGCCCWRARPHPFPPEAPLSFFIQKQHCAFSGADCTRDSIDCFSTFPCLFLFIWLLYFRDLLSLFWPWQNLLFYFWLHFYFKQTQQDLVLGSGLLPAVFAQNRGVLHSPGQG